MSSRIIEQGTEEWFKIRAGRFTSSGIYNLLVQPRSKKDREAGLMGKTAKTYIREKLQERLTGKAKESGDYKQTMWGHENEPLARDRYEEITRNEVELVGFIPHGHNAGCSTDGFVSFDGLVEIKCPFAGFIERVMEDVEKNREYYTQIQDELRVTGRKWCDYVVFDPRMPKGKDISITRVLRDEDKIAEIEDAIERSEEELMSMKEDFEAKIALTQKLAQVA